MKATEETLKILQENHICTTNSGRMRFKAGDELRVRADARIEPYSGIFSGNVLSSYGAFSYSWSSLGADTTIGRYCSLAGGIRFFSVEHPYHRFTSSSLTYDRSLSVYAEKVLDMKDYSFRVKPISAVKPIVIGNDVWIGSNVAIKPGVQIGDGAVIATGAIVTKNVEPYFVSGGTGSKYKIEV